MTTASFAIEAGRMVSFSVEGHSGLAEAGEDVLCAAITSAVRLTECAINDVLCLEASVKVSERDASVTLKLPSRLEDSVEETCQTLLAAFLLHLVNLAEEYPENITVLEV